METLKSFLADREKNRKKIEDRKRIKLAEKETKIDERFLDQVGAPHKTIRGT